MREADVAHFCSIEYFQSLQLYLALGIWHQKFLFKDSAIKNLVLKNGWLKTY